VKKSPYVSLPVELSKSTVKKFYRLNQNSLSSFYPPKENSIQALNISKSIRKHLNHKSLDFKFSAQSGNVNMAHNVTRVYAVADLRAAHLSTDAEDNAMQKLRNQHCTRN
jgi:hypothetical protein